MKINKIKFKKPFNSSLLTAFAAVFVVIGLVSLLNTFAAPAPNGKSSEAEASTITQNTSTVVDTNASGGSYLELKTATTPPPVNNSKTNCILVPSNCGYPDSTNTGPVIGTIFKKVPQDITSGQGWEWELNFARLRVTGNGAILNGLNISGPVVIDSQNVTISNSIVNSCGTEGDIIAIRSSYPGSGYDGNNALIKNNKLICNQPTTNRARSGVRDVYGQAKNVQVFANDISGTGNGITLEFSGVAKDNWIHDLGHIAGDHHSGLSTHGGAESILFEHNTLLLANTPTVGGGGLSGAITSYGDFARAQNMTAQNNFVSGGSYTVYGGINNESVYGDPINIKFLNNRFVCNSWLYGPAFLRTGSTNSFTGNFCDSDLSIVNP